MKTHFKVWHYGGESHRFRVQAADSWPWDYDEVADVEATSLGEVYQLTNTIHHPWWTNPGVFDAGPTRSTSVGDVIVDVETGKVWAVDSVGFKDLTGGGRG